MIPVPERKRCREPGKEPSENKISLQKKMFPKEEKTSAERTDSERKGSEQSASCKAGRERGKMIEISRL